MLFSIPNRNLLTKNKFTTSLTKIFFKKILLNAKILNLDKCKFIFLIIVKLQRGVSPDSSIAFLFNDVWLEESHSPTTTERSRLESKKLSGVKEIIIMRIFDIMPINPKQTKNHRLCTSAEHWPASWGIYAGHFLLKGVNSIPTPSQPFDHRTDRLSCSLG